MGKFFMKKTPIDVIEQAGLIMAALKKGILITSAKDGKVNSMTISWGALGIEWNKNIFTTYVRESRFTRTFIEETGEFTVNLPIGAFDPQITKICGSKSGRDCDKIKELNLHPVAGDEVQVPGLLELPLTLECRIVMKSLQDPMAMTPDCAKWYPEDAGSGKADRHIAYHAEILRAYIIEND